MGGRDLYLIQILDMSNSLQGLARFFTLASIMKKEGKTNYALSQDGGLDPAIFFIQSCLIPRLITAPIPCGFCFFWTHCKIA